MKILRIKIKNLASLEGVTEIDFSSEPLKSAGIFAITGPTGAGKSTILDALCLALYGKTPRYLQARESGIEVQDITGNKISQGDTRGVLRDGTADGFAEVEFLGVDGVKYKAAWSVRRSRGRTDGVLQPDSVELTNLNTNLPIAARKTETLKEIERLVGLNFEQFTRSVLLAQGDFTAFLKADKDAKSSLLEKLTGTDIYSQISKTVFDTYRQAEQTLKSLTDKIENIVMLGDEELAMLLQQQEELDLTIKAADIELGKLKDEINWHQSYTHLLAQRDTAKTTLTEAESSNEAATDRFLALYQVEGIQPARSLVSAKNQNQELLRQKEQAYHELETGIIALKQKHEAAFEKLAEADRILTEKQKQNEAAKPALEKARELDTLIKEKAAQVAEAEMESTEAAKKRDEQAVLVKTSAETIATNEVKMAGLQSWKTENSSRQPVADNIIVISTKLSEATKLLEKHLKLSKEKETLADNTRKTEEDLYQQNATVSAQSEAIAIAMANFDAKKEALQGTHIDEITLKQSTLNTALTDTRAANVAWDLYHNALIEKNILSTKLDDCRRELAETKKEWESKSALLQEARVKKEQTDKLFSQAQLQVAENVEDLRGQLIEDDPCPVCGSTHHPFATENPELHKVLQGLEKEAKKCQAIYEKLLRESSGLQSLDEKLGKDRAALETELKAKSDMVKTSAEKWKASRIDKACFALQDAEIPEWLKNQVSNLSKQLQENTDQIETYNKTKAALDKLKEDIDVAQNKLNEAHKIASDLENRYKNQMVEAIRLAEQVDNYNADIDAISLTLSPFFENPAWLDNWKLDPNKFEESIKLFAANWNTKSDEIAALTQSNDILKTKQQGLQGQLTAYQNEANLKNTRLQEQNEVQTKLNAERSEIFNGEDVDAIVARLKNAIEAAENQQKAQKEAEDHLQKELLNAGAKLEQTEKDISEFRDAIEKCNDAIISWMDDYNLSHEMPLNEESLYRLLTFGQAWMEKERQFKSDIENALLKAETTFKERDEQVIDHEKKKLSAREIEELTEMQTEIQTVLAVKNREQNEIGFKIRQDSENKNKAGKLLVEIQEQSLVHENWAKLNELIGSADGKKFRQIAQEYTLDILLGFANVHLQDLSSRYKLLRIPGSLGLQVLDMDMGDELRTVYSLSGGESFLVSLALALGLASLSSDKMKVESLFIDEGFGSLDPATLNIAMDALERLHNQGRKVGVISHVEEMTERIPTRIKVSKLSNGKSKIEVVSTLY